MPCHVMASRAMPGYMFACHAIFLHVVPCHDHSVPCRVKIFLEKCPVALFLTSRIYAHSLPRVQCHAIFCLPVCSQPRLNLLSIQQHGSAPLVWGPHTHTPHARPHCCVLSRLSLGLALGNHCSSLACLGPQETD